MLEVIIALVRFTAHLKTGKPGSKKLKSAYFLQQGACGAACGTEATLNPLKCFASLSPPEVPFSLSFGIVSEHPDNFLSE